MIFTNTAHFFGAQTLRTHLTNRYRRTTTPLTYKTTPKFNNSRHIRPQLIAEPIKDLEITGSKSST